MKPEEIKNEVRNNLPTGYDEDGKCLHPRITEDGTCDVCGVSLPLPIDAT